MISAPPSSATVIPLEANSGKRAPDLHETCQLLLRRLGWPNAAGKDSIRTLGFTSCYSGEGVSTIAAHVAFSAALTGPQRVILVDLNFARPSIHQCLEVEAAPGVRDILAGQMEIQDAVQCTSLTQFMALTAGTASATALRINPAALNTLVENLSAAYDLVIFDLPACDQASVTLAMAGLLDGVCLVVEAERVRSEVALRTKEQLERSGANLVGAVMNKQPRRVPEWLYRTL